MGHLVDDGSRDGENAKPFGKIWEFGGFNAIGTNKIAFHGELVRQAHGRRTMRSGGCGKHLQVERLGKLGQLLAAFGLQS
jgi:hypothetical protein